MSGAFVSRKSRGPAPRTHNADGFTLVELIAVLGILAMASALAVPAFREWLQEDDLTVATRRVEALFRIARDSAIRGGVPVTVVIDSVSSLVWLDAPVRENLSAVASGTSLATASGPPLRLQNAGGAPSATEEVPAGTSLELPGTVRLELSTARARFTFAPGGAAFADSLVLRTPLDTRRVKVHPWTGDVIIN